MARKTSTKTQEKVETKPIKSAEELEKENNNLRKELDEIKKILDQLTNKQEEKNDVVPKMQEDILEEPVGEVEIRPNKYIKVMSLVDGVLVLSTQSFGQGKVFRFEKFGEVKNIVYSELAEIIHCQQLFAEQGRFYIMDKNVVHNHGLVEYYKNILTKEMIENILNYNRNEMIDLFKNATKAQQETIVSILVNKIINDEDIDLNKVDAISRVYGKNIIDMAEEAKQYQVDK